MTGVATYKFTLTYGATTLVLNQTPAGWNEMGITFERNEVYHSVLRSRIGNLRFGRKPNLGGDLIKTAYDVDGLSANVSITIKKRNTQTNDYDVFYTGILDFKTIIIDRDFIEINSEDGSKEALFKAREEIDYNLRDTVSTDDTAITQFSVSHKNLRLKPIDIYLWAIFNGEIIFDESPTGSFFHSLYFDETSTELNILGDRLFPSVTRLYENTTGSSLNVDFTIPWTANLEGSASTTGSTPHEFDLSYVLRLVRYNSSGGVVSITNISSFSDTDTQQFRDGIVNDQDILHSDTGEYKSQIGLSDGDYIALQTEISGDLSNASLSYEFSSSFQSVNIVENYPSPAATTNSDTFFPYEAFTRLIQLSTSETDTSKLLHSDFFGRTDSEFQTYASDGEGSLIGITSGRNIRRYPNDPIIANARELFSSFDTIFNLGLGFDRVNDRFFIEKKADFYKDFEMFDLGDVSGLKISPAEKKYYSQMVIGQRDTVKYKEAQGALEFNVKSEFSSVIPVKNPLPNRSKYHTDSLGVEFARRSPYYSTGAEDTDYDENIYLIASQRAGLLFESIQGSDYDSVSGIVGIEGYYNFILSPKRSLLRWGNILKGMLWKNTLSKLKFVNSQKDVNVSSKLGSTDPIITEHDDVNYSELDDALFYPEMYEFESPISKEIVNQLNADPHGYVTFNFNGETFEGFLIKVTTKDYSKKADWQLIRKA